MDANIWQSDIAEWAAMPSIWGILAVGIMAFFVFRSERASDWFFVIIGHSLIGAYFAIPALLITMMMKFDTATIGALTLIAGAAGTVWSYRRSD